MRTPSNFDELDLYIWEGKADILDRIARCMASFDVEVIRADGMPPSQERVAGRSSLGIISVTVIDSGGLSVTSEVLQGMPVIWVAAANRGRDTRHYPEEYQHILPFDFTGAELRTLVTKLVQQMRAHEAEPDQADTLVANSECMQTLLTEVSAFANCDHNVLMHGETGVGKERIAQQLHMGHELYGRGPFIAVNCGAIPDGLFESLFFGHARGSFTGAAHAHRGYFEQATGGTLFLDEIGDLPRYQQVKLLRVLEENVVTRLGSTMPIKLDFRLVAATNCDLRDLVQAGDFRADLFYRLAVIELQVPSLEERGAVDKIAIFKSVMASVMGDTCRDSLQDLPYWLTDAIADMYFPGNVRQLRNLAERVGVIVRQTGAWDQPLIERALALARRMSPPAAPTPAESPEPGSRRNWDATERNRIISALEAKGWRRLETAQLLGISRKVLWEKMRKYQITDGEPEIPQAS